MIMFFNTLRELNTFTMMLRLVLAMVFGGAVGLEREHKRMPAGFRTYMLVCLGSTLAMMLGRYQLEMLQTRWADIAAAVGVNVDISRYGAQVVNGMGFLGAGTIIVTNRHEIKGMTTAAGLWACGCMGIAIGAGFYECALVGLLLIFLSVTIMPIVEEHLAVHSKDISIYMEFFDVSGIGYAVGRMKLLKLELLELELDTDPEIQYPNAVFRVKLPSGADKAETIMQLSQMSCVHTIHRML